MFARHNNRHSTHKPADSFTVIAVSCKFTVTAPELNCSSSSEQAAIRTAHRKKGVYFQIVHFTQVFDNLRYSLINIRILLTCQLRVGIHFCLGIGQSIRWSSTGLSSPSVLACPGKSTSPLLCGFHASHLSPTFQVHQPVSLTYKLPFPFVHDFI